MLIFLLYVLYIQFVFKSAIVSVKMKNSVEFCTLLFILFTEMFHNLHKCFLCNSQCSFLYWKWVFYSSTIVIVIVVMVISVSVCMHLSILSIFFTLKYFIIRCIFLFFWNKKNRVLSLIKAFKCFIFITSSC